MKVKKLTIKNIGIIEDIEIPANQPLILFYGEICQGKTTILNAVRWACGGQFPADIIRHGATEAYVALETDSGSIRREWYVGKDGETKAREVTFIRDGKVVKRPVDEIKRFLPLPAFRITSAKWGRQSAGPTSSTYSVWIPHLSTRP